MACGGWRVPAAVALSAAALFVLLRPAQHWSVAGNGRIILDADELGVAKHPLLFTCFNALLRALPPAWMRWLVPLDEAHLVAAARARAAAQCGAPPPKQGFRLLGSGDYHVLPYAVSPEYQQPSRGGLRALLEDLDGEGEEDAASSPSGRGLGVASSAWDTGAGWARLTPFGRFATQQQVRPRPCTRRERFVSPPRRVCVGAAAPARWWLGETGACCAGAQNRVVPRMRLCGARAGPTAGDQASLPLHVRHRPLAHLPCPALYNNVLSRPPPRRSSAPSPTR